MRSLLRRPSRLAAVTALMAVALTASAALAEDTEPVAFDYVNNPGVSEPVYAGADIARTVVQVTAFDGVKLYVEVVRPKAEGRYPVILEASPYHGTLADRDGTRILPDPKVGGASIGLTGFFAPRGYAVVYMDLRGTGRSGGCLDHLGPNDGKDMKTIVEWAAAQSWSNGKVGMTGHSYVGSTPMVAAAQNPTGLTTIVPSAGLASMYDHQFQGGVPYLAQWVGPMAAYEALTFGRMLPPGINNAPNLGNTGDDFGNTNNAQYTGCGLPQSSVTAGEGQATGRWQAWHTARDSSAGAKAAQIPTFLVHGVNDNAARIPAAQWFMDRGGRAGDKAWIGQWDHGSGCCPNRRGMQWPFALLAWFDYHLKGLDVNTGPAAEVFMNDAGTVASAVSNGGEMTTLQADGFPSGTSTLNLYPVATGNALATEAPTAAGTKTFAGDPRNAALSGANNVTFTTPAFDTDVVIAGVPTLELAASVTVPQVHLIATVYDVNESNQSRRIGTFAINPLLKDGVRDYAVVVPGTKYILKPPGFAMGHQVLAGHKLSLSITTSDAHHVPHTAIDPQITVHTGPGNTALHLPVVDAPVVVADDVER